MGTKPRRRKIQSHSQHTGPAEGLNDSESDSEQTKTRPFAPPVLHLSWKHLLAVAVVASFAVACTFSSVHNGFVFDDRAAVKNNKDVTQNNSVWQLFWHDFWGQPIAHRESHKSYRPITILMLRLDHHLAGSTLDPFFFHLGNIITHVLACVLVFFVSQIAVNATSSSVSSLLFPTIASLLFAGHPIHTEAIANVVGRAELLCMLFYAAGLLAYSRAAFAERTAWRPFGLSVLFFTLSVFAKETGITMLGVLAVYDLLYVFLHDDGLVARLPSSPIAVLLHSPTLKWRVWFKRILALAASGVAYLYVRARLMGEFTPVSVIRILDNPLLFVDRPTRILTIPYLHFYYLRLLVFPDTLCSDYSYNALPVIDSVADPRNLLSLLPYVALVFVWLAIRSTSSGNDARDGSHDKESTTESDDEQGSTAVSITARDVRLILFALAWMVIPFLPASHVFLSVGTFIGERLMYIPSLGFCMLVAWVVVKLWERADEATAGTRVVRTALLLAVAVVLLLYAVRSDTRNRDWESEETLFVRAYQTFPGSAKNAYNMANIQLRHERWADALRYLEEALAIWPEYCNVYRHMGMANMKLGKTWTGMNYYHRGAECAQTKVKSLQDLEVLYKQLIAHRPSNVTNYEKLAFVYAERKKYPAAVQEYERGLKLNPNHVGINTNLGVLYAAMGARDRALQCFQRVLQQEPNHATVREQMRLMGIASSSVN